MNALTAVQLTEPIALHGEGPVWDVHRRELLWVDMLGGRVLVTGPDGDTRVCRLPDPVASLVRPIAGSREHVVVGELSIWQVDLDRAEQSATRLVGLPCPIGFRSNEGCCSPSGDLFVGIVSYAETPGSGRVVRWGGAGDMETVLEATTVANGQQFLDSETVAFVDSADRSVGKYAVSSLTGRWEQPILYPIPDDVPGDPDGICVDVMGAIWVAMWDGGCVVRLDARGKLTDRVDLPVPRPTSVALGGPELTDLFITTSALDQPAGWAAGAGALFRVRVGVPGVLCDEWKPAVSHP